MRIGTIFTIAKQFVKSNDSEILTGVGVIGVGVTAYLSARAAYRSRGRLESSPPDLPVKEKARIVWDLYIPPVATGALTIACVLGSARVNSKRTAAAVAAYSVVENTLSEYRKKVVEELGERKEQVIQDKIATERLANNPPNQSQIIITDSGNVLCCEGYTGRYFRSNIETLRKAQNDINVRIINNLYVTLDEFYNLIDIPHTQVSDKLGWDSDKIMELSFSAAMGPKGEPCLSFDYNYVKPL